MKFFITSRDIGIDLGTSNTLVYVKGKGVLLNEPTVMAVNTRNSKVLAVGLEAKKMVGRTPEDIETVTPMKDGVIANFDLTAQMLRRFMEKVIGKGVSKSSRIVICHPSGITEVEKRSIHEIAREAGAGKVMLIEEPVAAAIGAGLPVNEPIGSMIIDIGGGTTEIAVISLGGIVTSRTLRVAGNELDDAIINYIKKEFNLLIGETTAEEIKIQLGSVYKEDDREEGFMEVRGRDLITGLPRVVTIREDGVREAIKESVAIIIEAIRATLEKTEPELAADIMDKGIMLSGGGALLRGLDKLIFNEMHIQAYIAEEPLQCAVLGVGKCLDVADKIKYIEN